jgi:hypothetical protein
MKVRHYRAFWILAGLFVACVFGLCYIVYALSASVGEQSGKAASQMLLGNPFEYPDLWNTMSWLSGWLLFIPGLIIIMLMTNEYTFRTHRQNVIDGLSRTQFITVKLLWVLVLSVLAAVTAFLSVILFGAFGSGGFTVSGMHYVLYFFVESLSYMMLALLFGVLIRRSGLAIGMLFLYLFVIKYFLASTINHNNTLQIGDYTPLRISDDLLPFPFLKAALKGKIQAPPPVYILLLGSFVYMGLFYWLMRWRFRTADL